MKQIVLAALLLTGCTQVVVEEAPAKELTVGVVQREIRLGMAACDVAQVLGSPNIVTLDEKREEVWVWDKVSSQIEYSHSGGGVWLVVVGGGKESGKVQRSQKTFTVIVKFDADKKVKDFTYHSSRF